MKPLDSLQAIIAQANDPDAAIAIAGMGRLHQRVQQAARDWQTDLACELADQLRQARERHYDRVYGARKKGTK